MVKGSLHVSALQRTKEKREGQLKIPATIISTATVRLLQQTEFITAFAATFIFITIPLIHLPMSW